MINELTFRQSSNSSPTRIDQLLTNSLSRCRSPRSPRIVQQIVVGYPHGSADSPVKQRIVNYEGELSRELLQKLDERFVQTQQMLSRQLSNTGDKRVFVRQPSPIRGSHTPKKSNSDSIAATEVHPIEMIAMSPSLAKSPSRTQTRPFCSEYVIRLNNRKREAQQLLRQYERNRNKLNSLIAASQQR